MATPRKLQELVNEAARIADGADSELIRNIGKFEAQLFKEIIEILRSFTDNDGRLRSTSENMELYNKLRGKIKKVFERGGYDQSFARFLRTFPVIENIAKEQLTIGATTISTTAIKALSTKTIREVILGAITDQIVSKSGIETNFIKPLQRIIYNVVEGNSTYNEAENTLKDWAIGNDKKPGKITQYATQLTRDSINQFEGAIHQKAVNELGFDGFRYVGSLLPKDSRQNCIDLINGTGVLGQFAIGKREYRISDLPQIIELAETRGGWNPLTTPATFFIYRAGYNCRHFAIPFEIIEINNASGVNIVDNIDALADATAKEAEKIHKGDIAGYERSVYRDIEGLNKGNNNLKTTEQLKKEVGRYISTEKIHGKDNVAMPQDVKYHIQGLGKSKVDELINKNANKTIKVSDINIIQQYVFEKPLKKAIVSKDYKVVVYELKGKYYLNDGNHRVAAAKLNNVKSIKVVIEKVN